MIDPRRMPWPDIPAFPPVEIEVIEQDLATTPGFLELRRARLRARRPGGELSREFVYDSVTRRALDAVVIVAHHMAAGGEPVVFLRSAIRPSVAERAARPTPDATPQGVHFWELPAGLVEPEEQSVEGLRRCAARETREELGFELDPDRFEALGHGIYPTAGVIAERQFFFHVEVDPIRRGNPTLDGSPLEEGGVVFPAPLSLALDMCGAGQILDGKTELGLRRFTQLITRGA
jgi:ADP-ribose pyrophosphatase